MTWGKQFRAGDWWRIDDRTGFRVRASQTRQEWTGQIVDERRWEPRHPQDFVRGVRDQQAVPQARPRTEPALFIGTQPSFYIYNDPNVGSCFIIENPYGPGPYNTPSNGLAYLEILPGNGNANSQVPLPAQISIADSLMITIQLPLSTLPQVIGMFNASNNPTSFAIISGNNQNFFAVDNSGNLSIISASIVAGMYAIVVQPSNTYGLGLPGTATVTVLPAVSTGPVLMDSEYVPSLG